MSAVLHKMPELVGSKEEKETRGKRKTSKSSEKCNVASENGRSTNGLALEEKSLQLQPKHEFGPRLKIIKVNDQVHELQTILRDK